MRADCPDIYGGSSGSPVIDRSSGLVVAIVNTTTLGSGGGSDCFLGRPCEVTGSAWSVAPDTSYVMPTTGLAACFDAAGGFALGGACPLDPGSGVVLSGAPQTANPNLPGSAGRPPVTRWATTMGGDGFDAYRTKTGPLGSTDCEATSGYGDAKTIANDPVVDDPLPTTEGQYVLCALGHSNLSPGDGWQEPRFASFASVLIDTTPPRGVPQLSVRDDGPGGWSVEPIFAIPEFSDYSLKAGPARQVDCADANGYVRYRRVPIVVPAEGAPAAVCIQSYDDANNPAPPRRVELPRGEIVTFEVAGTERFKVELVRPEDIAHARKLLNGEAVSSIPLGKVIWDDPGINAPWSWHIDPATFQFAFAAIEVCDGLPSHVEEGVVTSDTYCPWSAKVVGLEPAP